MQEDKGNLKIISISMASDLKCREKAPLTYIFWLAYVGQHDLHKSGQMLPVGFPQSLVGRGFVVSPHVYTGLAQGGFKGN